MLPGVDEIVRGERLAVAPAGVVVELEQVRQAVGRDAEVLGQRGHHVQLAVDDQKAAEQVLGERARVRDVGQARRQRARPDDGSGQPLAQLGLEEGLDLARERLVVGALGALEVEREVVHERDLEQRLARAAVVAEAAQELPRAPVVADRLAVGGEAARLVAGADQVLRRLGGVVGGRVVAGELGERARAGLVARQRLERGANPAVELAAAGVGQHRVGRLLHEPVAEPVLRVRPAPLLDDQLEPLEIGERRGEPARVDEPLEQRDREPAADDRRHGGHLAGAGLEPVEARLENALHEQRHLERVRVDGQLPPGVAVPHRAPLDDVAQRLGGEQRVPARALADERGDRLGDVAVGQLSHERAGRVGRERAQLELAVAVRVALAGPLADPPRAGVAVGPVEERDADRVAARSARAAPRSDRASARRPSAGPRRRAAPGARARARTRGRRRRGRCACAPSRG